MPAVKTKRISTLIESQLPEFITTEYELFSKFVQKYYEAQEVQGGTLDVINNIQKYADIDFYEKNLLKQNDTLAASISDTDTTIVLDDASSFPEKNGYVRIDDEIIFYETRTDTELQSCARGVSGNTTLGDLYDSSNFVSTNASSHVAGKVVHNISNLFLYAFVKNFENQYLGSFPEKYLKGEVDKRTLIKNIQKFYKSKGTSSSIKFIFNTIVAKDIENKPEVYNPREFTYKASNADWINVFALKCKVVSGNAKDLIGKVIVQTPTDEYGYSSATVDNVYEAGKYDGESIWNIVLAPETVNGEFAVSTKTKLERTLPDSASSGNTIDVFSTTGWDPIGSVLIGSETISFDKKSINQFFISRRGSTPVTHNAGEFVYKPATISSDDVTLLTLGVVYNLSPESESAYASSGDTIQVSEPGFRTADPRINLTGTNQVRWILNDWQSVSSTTNIPVQTALEKVPTNVSAILADDQYYYITGSGYPSYNILDRSIVTEDVRDQNLLRIIRKSPTVTTEIYETPQSEVGILLNGVRLYSYKDSESIRFGKLESIRVDARGRNYAAPPFVLIDGVAGKARSVLTGSVVDSIIVDTTDIFLTSPNIEVTSGRGATARAVVTGGEVTSIVIENAGKFYSSPPRVVIRDLAGRGRFAEYNSTINTDGNITGFEKISGGTLYTQENIEVSIIAVGEGASASPLLKKWIKNKFAKYQSKLDSQFGYVFENYDRLKYQYGYGQLANPKALRVQLGDNLNSADTEPSVKTHSPILGFAYDGNPIYGPFGHENPLDSNSPIVRMTSSYSIRGGREDGPATREYPLGTFVDDYLYQHKSGSLDENNGRFCITPDFPEGTYAYFITIDSNQSPKFPYILGKKFYSLPVDSNYNSPINQADIPKNAKRLFLPGIPSNGEGLVAQIAEVQSGSIDGVDIDRTSNNFSVNCDLYFNNNGTEGSEVEALVSSVKGKNVNYLQSKEDKVVKLTTIQSAYLFTDDTLRQPASGASGKIVGTVTGDNIIVLKNVVGTFNNTGTFSADIKTFQITVDQDSNYTKGAILSLTDGINPAIAKGEILEGTSRQNTVKIKVTEGTWIIDDDYFLQSSNLFNTSGSKIVTLVSLSDNLEPFEVNQSVALIETTENHGLGIGDDVEVSIFPDDATKTKNYYIRKRLYQQVTLIPPRNSSKIDYTGLGRFTILNGGADYTEGVYNNVPLTGGSGSGAIATITVSEDGLVNRVQIQDGGSGYKKGDYLGVEDDELERTSASLSSSRLAVYVDHVGVSRSSASMRVKTAKGFAVNDLVSVGSEVLKIISINGNNLGIERGKEGTEAVDLFEGQEVSLYKPRYNFTQDYPISSAAGTGYVKSYDFETQEATIVFDYSINKTSANDVTTGTAFFDSSSPQRLISVASVDNVEYKFEISEDNATFVPNPNINIQEFYKYVFDTSHSSLTGTYFDMSPSKSFNLITLEKTASNILPGNNGSFTEVKFGFGSRLAQNDYTVKRGTNFTNFYYFDRNGIVDSDGSYLSIVTDPLQGRKKVNYVTPNRFVYDIPSEPLWDGSGTITYTTKGQFAVGEINEISIINSGGNYKRVPLVLGVNPSESFRGTATVLFDTATKVITSVRIDSLGSNYVNPIAVITDGDGVGARFRVIQKQGKLFSITVENPGRGYSYAPTIKIIESDVELYATGSNIGIPRGVTIIDNGGSYHLDKTVSSEVTSQYTVSLSNFSGEYQKGEILTQTINGVEVLRARVSEYRSGTNLLKLESTRGIIRENVSIVGKISRAQGTVKKVFVTTFTERISSFFDNLGYYKSDKGKLGVANQKLTDSFFYQDYSYVVKSKTSIEQWRDLIKSTTHPAGFKLFGQVDVETAALTDMPSAGNRKADTFTTIQLWDPNKNRITVESTKRVVTQTIQKLENTRIRKGQGSAATSEFNFNETRAFNFTLSAPFDGYFDTDGRLQGTTTFQVLDDFGRPFNPISAESLVVTLDGIIQEPKVAYTVSGDNIIFAAPPLGDNVKLTGQSGTDLTPYKGTRFLGRSFYFKDNQYNSRYIRKIRNIFQRNGRWIDAANQIERNKEFIIEETIGYGKQYYSSLDWSTKLDDYTIFIGYVLDAYQHDLRFGGNTKTIDYANLFTTTSDYVKKNITASLALFNYVTRLARLSIRNWDIIEENVNYLQGSNKLSVSNTKNLAIGMHVSSGNSYPEGTRIVSIDSDTEVTLSNVAFASSGGAGGASAGTTSLSGSTGGSNLIIPTSTGAVDPGNTFSVDPGDVLQVPISFSISDTATFYLSGINNGTFYDASNLIAANKLYLQEEISGYTYANYALPAGDEEKCKRDLGFLIDAVVYHLQFGGNQRVVEFAQLYYTNRGYPYGEELTYINRSAVETAAAIDAWTKLGEKMILAMRNLLGAGTYTSITPFVDLTVLSDTNFPICAEVESAINTYIDIVKDILEKGTGVVEVVEQNENKPGYWSTITTYSNYNIIADPLIPSQECDDVISSLDLLYANLDDAMNSVSVTKTLPDYIDGETKEFELFWENGDPVITEEDERFLLTINAVLQETKYNASYPGDDSYYIDRTVVPNKLVFDVAPIWDQYEGAKTLGEATAVEKVSGVGLGNYKRLTIDSFLVNNVRKGPFLILDLEDLTVVNVEQPDFLLVFVDGVLQEEGVSYTVSGPNIFFEFPVTEQMKVDMRYLYGRDVGQILTIFDYNPDQYYAKSTIILNTTSGLPEFLNRSWMGTKIGSQIQAYQKDVINPSKLNMLGTITAYYVNGNELKLECFGNVAPIVQGEDVYISVLGRYFDYYTIIELDASGSSITYERDVDQRILLSGNDQVWRGTFLRKVYKNPFVSLSNGSQIRVEGENNFRKIKELPSVLTSKEQRPQEQVSNSYFGQVNIESYNGDVRGEGLSIVAKLKNGKVLEVAIQNAGSGYSDATRIEIPEFTETINGVNVKKFGLVIDITTTGGAVTYIKIVEGGENYDIGDVIEIPGGNDGTFTISDVLDGYVSSLTWNQRSYNPITQPTAYQYYTPPVIHFIPQDGDGGGARAQVIVSKGQVISVDLISGGSGYTTAPNIVVARKYDVLEETDIGVSLINVRINAIPAVLTTNGFSTVSILGNQVEGISTFTSILFDSPVDTNRVITSIVTPKAEEVSSDLNAELDEILTTVNTEREAAPVDTQHAATYISVLIETPYIVDIESQSTLSTSASREITTTIHNIIQNNSLSNVNYFEVGAVLDVDLDPTDSIVYIPDTSKFKTNGFLLIGTEVVRYMRKMSDRFLMVQRGQNNTTAQFWPAGTFIRQIPDPVSVAPVGVVAVESQSQLVTLRGGSEIGGTERKVQNQIVTQEFTYVASREIEVEVHPFINVTSISNVESHVAYKLEPLASSVQSFSTVHKDTETTTQVQVEVESQFNIRKEHLQVLLYTPPSGVIDGYEESVFIDDPISTRLNGFVDLLDDYSVVKRNGVIIYAQNSVYSTASQYIGNYSTGNVGHTISHFDGIFDDGYANVSGLTLQEMSTYFPALTIRDFVDRAHSSYTLAGAKFNLMPPSIQNPVAISSSTGTIGGNIVVQDTTYFPDEGFLYHSIKGIPSATGTALSQSRFGTPGSVNLETNTDPKFGDTCVFLNEDGGLSGGGEYLSAIQPLGTGDFTVQFWFKPGTDPGFPNYSNLIYYGSNAITGIGFGSNQNQPDIGWSIQMYATDTATPSLAFWNGETQTVISCGTCDRGSWNHVAIERGNGVISVYVNGDQRASAANTQEYNNGTMGNNSNPFLAIGFDNNTIFDPFHGHIDNVHIQSAATYSGIPTTYGQPDQYTLLLENFDTPSNTYSGVIQYTSKTATSFEGCTFVNGDNVISNKSELVPYTIS